MRRPGTWSPDGDSAIEVSPMLPSQRARQASDGHPVRGATADGPAEKAEKTEWPASANALRGTSLRDRDDFPEKPPAWPSQPRTSPTVSGNPLGKLHERLEAFRHSAFGHTPAGMPGVPKPRVSEAPKVTGPTASARAGLSGQGQPAAASGSRSVGATGRGPSGTSRGGLQNPVSVHPTNPEAAALQRAVAERLSGREAARPNAPASLAPESQVPTLAPPKAANPKATEVKQPASVAAKGTDAVKSDDPGVLFLRQSPSLSIETHGPRRITVGKESAYEVVIRNSGQMAANDLVVTIELPKWADVVGAEGSAGTTQAPGAASGSGQLLWKVGRLDAKSDQKLALRIVPRQSRPFELGVKWSFTPVPSQAEIQVQEPKLALELDGPGEVLHGRKEVYKLKLTNTGTGPAENLLVKLTPIGPGQNVPASHKLGTLAAGQKKVIEVELTARHAGDLTIQVHVQGNSGVHAELNKKIHVRRAVLGITVAGPKLQYVGTVATYRIRVANTGDAPARNVTVSAAVPPGAEQVSGTQRGDVSPDGKRINWKLGELGPEVEQTLLVTCHLGKAGAGRLAVDATADDKLVASGAVTTRVEAIADLVLSVEDPAGPIPVDQETTYQVRIQNRGTKSAENVEAVGYFSQGIEPTSAVGAPHKIAPGQVVFGPIPSIPAGQTQLLSIQAKAQKPGNHVFRAEVYCRSLGARLVSEETTRFYSGGSASPESKARERSLVKAAAADPVPKTADRRSRIAPIRSSRQPLPGEGKKR